MKKWKKQRLEPCTSCGLNGAAHLSGQGKKWVLFL